MGHGSRAYQTHVFQGSSPETPFLIPSLPIQPRASLSCSLLHMSRTWAPASLHRLLHQFHAPHEASFKPPQKCLEPQPSGRLPSSRPQPAGGSPS